jgi:hypothetical protein
MAIIQTNMFNIKEDRSRLPDEVRAYLLLRQVKKAMAKQPTARHTSYQDNDVNYGVYTLHQAMVTKPASNGGKQPQKFLYSEGIIHVLERTDWVNTEAGVRMLNERITWEPEQKAFGIVRYKVSGTLSRSDPNEVLPYGTLPRNPDSDPEELHEMSVIESVVDIILSQLPFPS